MYYTKVPDITPLLQILPRKYKQQLLTFSETPVIGYTKGAKQIEDIF